MFNLKDLIELIKSSRGIFTIIPPEKFSELIKKSYAIYDQMVSVEVIKQYQYAEQQDYNPGTLSNKNIRNLLKEFSHLLNNLQRLKTLTLILQILKPIVLISIICVVTIAALHFSETLDKLASLFPETILEHVTIQGSFSILAITFTLSFIATVILRTFGEYIRLRLEHSIVDYSVQNTDQAISTPSSDTESNENADKMIQEINGGQG